MQFLRVTAKHRATGKILPGLPVLVNGESNGQSGNVLKLDQGKIVISVDHEGADDHLVNLKNTTYDCPMEFTVLVGDVDA